MSASAGSNLSAHLKKYPWTDFTVPMVDDLLSKLYRTINPGSGTVRPKPKPVKGPNFDIKEPLHAGIRSTARAQRRARSNPLPALTTCEVSLLFGLYIRPDSRCVSFVDYNCGDGRAMLQVRYLVVLFCLLRKLTYPFALQAFIQIPRLRSIIGFESDPQLFESATSILHQMAAAQPDIFEIAADDLKSGCTLRARAKDKTTARQIRFQLANFSNENDGKVNGDFAAICIKRMSLNERSRFTERILPRIRLGHAIVLSECPSKFTELEPIFIPRPALSSAPDVFDRSAPARHFSHDHVREFDAQVREFVESGYQVWNDDFPLDSPNLIRANAVLSPNSIVNRDGQSPAVFSAPMSSASGAPSSESGMSDGVVSGSGSVAPSSDSRVASGSGSGSVAPSSDSASAPPSDSGAGPSPSASMGASSAIASIAPSVSPPVSVISFNPSSPNPAPSPSEPPSPPMPPPRRAGFGRGRMQTARRGGGGRRLSFSHVALSSASASFVAGPIQDRSPVHSEFSADSIVDVLLQKNEPVEGTVYELRLPPLVTYYDADRDYKLCEGLDIKSDCVASPIRPPVLEPRKLCARFRLQSAEGARFSDDIVRPLYLLLRIA